MIEKEKEVVESRVGLNVQESVDDQRLDQVSGSEAFAKRGVKLKAIDVAGH